MITYIIQPTFLYDDVKVLLLHKKINFINPKTQFFSIFIFQSNELHVLDVYLIVIRKTIGNYI